MCPHSCLLSASHCPTTLSPTTPEITIDWRRSALVYTCALQSFQLTSSYRRNSARIRKMKRFKDSAGHFVSSSHSLISSRSAVKRDWELHGSWRCVLGHWRSALKEQFSQKLTPSTPLQLLFHHSFSQKNKAVIKLRYICRFLLYWFKWWV